MAAILRVAGDPPESGEESASRWLLATLLLLWLALTLPLALGESTLFLRDVFTSHLPRKAFGAAQLAVGSIPAIDPSWALGQPFRGDPNVLAFYPGNLLYRLLPFWSAFNLHYTLHWLLAFFAARHLARTLGQPPLAALLCGLTWAGCGLGLTLLTFYNLIVVAAWWPLAMAGLHRGGRRGTAGAALALGLALLGGEPVTAALGLVPLALVAVERHGVVRGLRSLIAAGAGALLVAAPQIVASQRVLGFTTRWFWGAGEQAAGRFALEPVRLLELLLPLPFGWPSRYGPFDYWSARLFPVVPFVFSLYVGGIGLVLALAAAPRARRWATLALAGLLVAWLGGVAPGALAALSGGLFRYPEKVLLWFFLAASLLAGWGLARWAELGERGRRLGTLVALALALLGAATWVAQGSAAALLADAMDPSPSPGAGRLQIRLAALALLAAAALLALALVCRRRPAALVGLQLIGLAQLAPLWATDDVGPYRDGSPWMKSLPQGAAVARFEALERLPAGPEAPATAAERARLDLADLAAAPGVLHGLRYPLAPDLVGLQSPLSARLELELRRLTWPERVAWLKRLGADALVVRGESAAVPLPRLASERHGGFPASLFAVPGVEEPAGAAGNGRPALAWWPRRVEVESDAHAAVVRLARIADPRDLSLVPRPLPHAAGALVTWLDELPDRLDFEVDGPGGVLVVRRAYLPLYRARLAGGGGLPTTPVDLALLGIVVPPGRQRVIVEVSSAPEKGAGVVASVAALALLGLCLVPPR